MNRSINLPVKRIIALLSCLLLLTTSVAGCVATEPCSTSISSKVEWITGPDIEADQDFNFIVFGDTRSKAECYIEIDPYYYLRNRVHQEVAHLLTDGDADFALYTGDLIYRGSSTRYWDEARSIIPIEIRQKDRPKIFPILGNHETWQEEDEGDYNRLFFETFPYLMDSKYYYHNYAFVVGSNLFLNLCNGPTGAEDQNDQVWNCEAFSTFTEFSKALESFLSKVKNDYVIAPLSAQLKNVFVQYHKPSYSTSQHAPLNDANDPLRIFMGFKKEMKEDHDIDLNLYVFNGHNHTTELYNPEPGVLVLVAGGGGAPQEKAIKKQVHEHAKEYQPEELFWRKIEPARNRRINYFRVYISQEGNQVEIVEYAFRYSSPSTEYFYPSLILDKDGKIIDPENLEQDDVYEFIKDYVMKDYVNHE